MSSRSGFALLTVLWLLFLLSLLLVQALSPILLSIEASENRVQLARAKWAAIGCLELARARYADRGRETGLDSVALGRSVWCAAMSLNADERINPNQADSVGLARAVGDEGAAAILDWIDSDDVPRYGGAEREWYLARGRPAPRNGAILSAREVGLMRGFEGASADELDNWFTARGDGRLSVNRAPAWTLTSVGVLSGEDVAKIVAARRPSVAFVTAEQLVSVADVRFGIDAFREVTRRLSFTDDARTTRFEGHVNAGKRTLHYALVASLQATSGRLAVQRVEIE